MINTLFSKGPYVVLFLKLVYFNISLGIITKRTSPNPSLRSLEISRFYSYNEH